MLKTQTTNSDPVWNQNKRYRVGDAVKIGSVTYSNTTGANSNPSSGIDWEVIFDSSNGGGTGTSLPDGGTTNQALRKISDTDQDFDWQDDPATDTEWSEIEGNQKDVNLIGFTDGISGDFLGFTEKNIIDNKNIVDLSFANGFFYATNYNGDASYQKSLDGEDWTNESFGVSGSEQWTAPIFENGIYISVGGNKVLTSTDGNNWVAQSVFSFQTFQITFKDGVFVVAGDFSAKKIAYSSDGFNWTEVTLPFLNSNNKVLVSSDNVFLLGSSTNADKTFYSSDGQNWNEVQQGLIEGSIKDIVSNGTEVYLVSVIGTNDGVFNNFYKSTNGINWELLNQVVYDDFSDVILGYGNDWFIFVNSQVNNELRISRDLITFQTLTLPFSAPFNSRIFAKDIFLIADEDNGRILGSRFTQPTIFENTINKVVDSNGVEVPITDKVLQLPPSTGNDSNKDTIGVFLSALGADLTTGATATIEAPYDFTLVSAFIAVTDAPTGGSVVLDFLKNGVSITSTNASIEANEFNSLTGIPPVFTTTSFVKGDRITHNIIQVGSLDTGRELKSYLEIIKT